MTTYVDSQKPENGETKKKWHAISKGTGAAGRITCKIVALCVLTLSVLGRRTRRNNA